MSHSKWLEKRDRNGKGSLREVMRIKRKTLLDRQISQDLGIYGERGGQTTTSSPRTKPRAKTGRTDADMKWRKSRIATAGRTEIKCGRKGRKMTATSCWCLPDRRTALLPNGYQPRWLSPWPFFWYLKPFGSLFSPVYGVVPIGSDDGCAVTASGPSTACAVKLRSRPALKMETRGPRKNDPPP